LESLADELDILIFERDTEKDKFKCRCGAFLASSKTLSAHVKRCNICSSIEENDSDDSEPPDPTLSQNIGRAFQEFVEIDGLDDCQGHVPPSNLFLTAGSSALAAIGCMFNIEERVIICKEHSAVVPTSGETPSEISSALQEHVRIHHKDVNQSQQWFKNLVASLGEVKCAQHLTMQRNTTHLALRIQGIPFLPGFRCQICNYCGPKKTVQTHVRNFHSGLLFEDVKLVVYMQRYELSGPYVRVLAPDTFKARSSAWQKMYDEISAPNSENSTDLLQNTSGFVHNAGWAGCVSGKEGECRDMTHLDDKALEDRIQQEVRDYVTASNTEIKQVNVTLRRWMESRGYVSLSLSPPLSLPPSFSTPLTYTSGEIAMEMFFSPSPGKTPSIDTPIFAQNSSSISSMRLE
jgi:hypothetical protein